ncbi:nucleotidyltransferase domain-containing protein [Candidatus Aeolococcus gillhamiae]|uniref:nucleotidyltransferase family protein n=1 Tax=Candidatus Aeolococcus gillhamiae TaxID=3127015 RepID=UPI0030785F0F
MARRHGASHIRVFGSVARATADDVSDVDLLVDLEAGRTLLDVVALERELSALLGYAVDVASRFRPSLRRAVERDEVEL